jgi:hypothetical protein
VSAPGPDPVGVFRTALSAGEAARCAEELVANPLLKEIFAELEHGAVTVWRRSTSPQQREEQWYVVVTISALRQQIESRIESVRLSDARQQKAGKDTR